MWSISNSVARGEPLKSVPTTSQFNRHLRLSQMFVRCFAGSLLPPGSAQAGMAQISEEGSVLPRLQAPREGVYFGGARGGGLIAIIGSEI
jgi:hypothetical protein